MKKKNAPYPYYERERFSTVIDMLEKKAENMPEQTAFLFKKSRDETETVSYMQVLNDVKVLAAEINGQGRHIAIIGENSYEWIRSFLAVLASGNVAVPIDKDLPGVEIAALIRIADISEIIISSDYADLTEGLERVTVRHMGQQPRTGRGEKAAFALYHPAPEEEACIFFTSGTTGVSKGAVLTHENITCMSYFILRIADMEDDTVFSVLPFHHEFGLISSVLVPYGASNPVFICRSPKHFKSDILQSGPGTMMVVPMFVELMHRQITDGIRKTGKERSFRIAVRISRFLCALGIDMRRKLFDEILKGFGGNLKYILCGGAYLDPKYIRFFRDIGIEILQAYGATECSPGIASNRNYYHKDGSVGVLLPCLEARISDEGEIQIRGPVVMKGYYNNSEETAKVLKDGWYATGDLGEIDADGFLYITGRLKNLIILSNGENISPEELENDFKRDDGVRDVMVCEEDNMLAAQIYPEDAFMGREDYFTALKDKINAGRPSYKQIRRITLRDQDFIRNSSRKIVRYKNTRS